MTTKSVNTCTHLTLTANTADTVTIAAGYKYVEVRNRDATNDVFFTVNGTTATVAGDDCYHVFPKTAVSVRVPKQGFTTAVSVISSGASAYSVTGTNP